MSSTNVARGHSPHILNVLFPLYAFAQPFIYFAIGATCKKPHHQDYNKLRSKPTATRVALHQMESIFVNALVQAASCRQHTRLPSPEGSVSTSAYTYHKARRRHYQYTVGQARRFHSSSPLAHTRTQPVEAIISREESLQMVDYYPFHQECYSTLARNIEVEQLHTVERIPYLERREDRNSPELMQNLGDSSHVEKSAIENLQVTLRDEDSSHEAIYGAYSAIPPPRITHLTYKIRRLLLRRLSVIERKTKEAMLRYLSVVDDMKAAGLPLTEAEWNSAIAYAGRCFVRVEAADIEVALHTWKEMEQEAGVQSGKVTFNILFDIAAKAGKFVLAEMILKEMDARRLRVNRFARVGFIYYHGLKGDGQGVRLAYRDFVESGGIVDTVVMNCVVASLIQAGELPSAEQVFERMKQMLSKKTGVVVPLMDWKRTRELGRALDRATVNYNKDTVEIQRIRNEQYLGPDVHTFAILIEHHATQTGELRRIAALIDEMHILGIPIRGHIFVKLFKGFAYHGGMRYTSWTKIRLESVWSSLQSVLEVEQQDVHVMKWMVIWVIRAFGKCCGRQRTLEIWEELITRWHPDSGEAETVKHILRRILWPRTHDDQEIGEKESP